MRYPPPAAGRFDCVETHGLRPCRRLRRRACGPPAPCTIPPPVPPKPSPSAAPFPKAKTLPPPAAGRFDCVETHGLRPCRRLRRRACGLPPAHHPAPCTPIQPISSHTISANSPPVSPCPRPIAPNFPQHCKLSVNTLRTYVLFRRHMLQ